MDNLKESTAKGFFWGLLNNGTTQMLNVIIGLVMLQVLTQEDYGLVGVLAIFAAIAGNLQSCGFSQALTNLKEARKEDYNAVFWFNILVGMACYVVLFFCAPLIADFYHDERLVSLSRFVFLAFLISSFGIAHGAYMYRNLMVKQTAIIGFVALVVSGGTGIVMALHGFSYWSMAWQQVIYILILNLGRYAVVPWHPIMKIDLRPLKPWLAFSMNMLFTNVLNTLSQNILTVIIGRLYPMKQVGTYQTAYKWDFMAYSFLKGMIDQVAQPVLARITDDRDREKRVFRKMARFMAFLSFPFMLGLCMVSPEFFASLLPPRWAASVPLMQVLCVSGAFMPFYTLYSQLAVSKGRSDVYLWMNVAQIGLIVLVVIAASHWGIVGMVYGYSGIMIAYLLAWQYWAHRFIGVRLWEILTDTMPFLLGAVVTMAVTYVLTSWIHVPAVLLGVRVVVAAMVYFALMKMARVRILDECLEFVLRKNRKK